MESFDLCAGMLLFSRFASGSCQIYECGDLDREECNRPHKETDNVVTSRRKMGPAHNEGNECQIDIRLSERRHNCAEDKALLAAFTRHSAEQRSGNSCQIQNKDHQKTSNTTVDNEKKHRKECLHINSLYSSGLTAQISRRCMRSAAFALLGNDAIISICYSIVPHKLFPSKVQ